MRASDLADRLCADPSTVSRQVAGLVKAGLVERRADPDDGRASILVPTPEGQVRVDRMIEMRGRLFAPLVAGWSSDDRAVFSRLLTEFAHGLIDRHRSSQERCRRAPRADVSEHTGE